MPLEHCDAEQSPGGSPPWWLTMSPSCQGLAPWSCTMPSYKASYKTIGAISMGLFDSLFGGMEGGGKLTVQEGFAGILLGASACDGHISDDEVTGLVTALLRMKLFQRINEKSFGQMMNKLQGIAKKKGVDTLIDVCVPVLPQELRETAFANACDIVLADGVVEPDEREFVDKLQRKLGISGDTALAIVQVMVIKNQG